VSYCLHNILKGVQSDVSCSGVYLGVHGHGETLADGGEDKRPFTSKEWHLYGAQGENGA
jgi:hypothetical protein